MGSAQRAGITVLCLLASLQRLSTISQQMPECWSQLQDYAATLKRKMFGEVNVYQESRLVLFFVVVVPCPPRPPETDAEP